MKAFGIDFIRQVLEQTFEEQHNLYPEKYFGGKSQLNLFSFYEQLQDKGEVDRYTEIFKDLINQQNRTGLIMNGTIIAPENPTIANINQTMIMPMTFTCSFRVKLGDRDSAIDTIDNLISILKGRKQDVALLDNGSLFKVGTLANNSIGTPRIENGDYLGEIEGTDIDSEVSSLYEDLIDLGLEGDVPNQSSYFYVKIGNELKAVYFDSVEGEYFVLNDNMDHPDIIIPIPHSSFTKYKLSLSFDSIRCDEPRVLNADEYCIISFGGSATLTNEKVLLGNDLTKIGIKKLLVKGDNDISINGDFEWLEPLELPSSNSIDKQVNQLVSNKFIQNSHNDSLNLSLQYSFIVDKSIPLISQWFDFARYGIQANGSVDSYENAVSPNLIYLVEEIWSSWGIVNIKTIRAKITESIDIENNESDVLSITVPLQVQGENN